jgi:hypothetical protein
MNNNVHKSKRWSKHVVNYTNSVLNNVFIFQKLNHFLKHSYNTYPYVFYFLKRYNKKIKVKRNFWKSYYNYRIITFNQKKNKLDIIVKNYKKILLSLSSGISAAKLGMEEKKNKKSNKVFNIMVKSVFKGLKPANKLIRYIIQFKGTRSNLTRYIEYIIQLEFKFKETYIIYTPSIPNTFKYKKIKALKKNFKKNYLRI